MNLNQITLPVDDMDAASRFYRQLGLLQIVETPNYARFECPNGATFSLALRERPAQNASVIYFESDRLDAWVDELVNQGFGFDELPTDKRYLWREAALKDPSGNRIKLYYAGRNRRHPPWRVERREP